MVQTVSKLLEKQGLTLRSGDWAVRGPRVQCVLVTDWGGSSGESVQILWASWSSRDSGTTSFVTCFGRGSPACVNGLGDGSSGFCDSFWGQRRVGNVQIPRPCSPHELCCTQHAKCLLWSHVLSPSGPHCIVLGNLVTLGLFYPTEDMSEGRLMARDLIKTVLHDQVPQPPVAPGPPSVKEPVEEAHVSPVRDLDLVECLEYR